MTMRSIAVALAVFLAAGPVLAQECPDEVPEDTTVRRQQAKKYFSQGEESTKLGDDVGALKAYQCSLKFVPHGFTAFNIGQIAERVGDLELAVSSYNQYLLLVPDATDGPEVSRKIGELKQRLVKVKRQEKQPPPPRPLTPQPLPTEAAAVEPPPVVLPPAPTAEPPVESVSASEHSGLSYRTWAWISYGGAGAFILGGLITNLMARSKMDTCRSTFNQQGKDAAQSSCDAAKPLAYTSYALFGVGGAAVAVGTFFVLRPTESSEVAMAPLPQGGATLRYSGRF